MTAGISRPIDWVGAGGVVVTPPAGGFNGLLDFTGISIGSGSGTTTYTDTGGAIAIGSAVGADAVTYADAGAASSVLVGSGTQTYIPAPVTYTDFGGAVGEWIGSGATGAIPLPFSWGGVIYRPAKKIDFVDDEEWFITSTQ